MMMMISIDRATWLGPLEQCEADADLPCSMYMLMLMMLTMLMMMIVFTIMQVTVKPFVSFGSADAFLEYVGMQA